MPAEGYYFKKIKKIVTSFLLLSFSLLNLCCILSILYSIENYIVRESYLEIMYVKVKKANIKCTVRSKVRRIKATMLAIRHI